MKPEWQKWIDELVEMRHGFVRGACAEATTAMVATFSELRRVAGFAYWTCPTRDVRDQHWWCVAPDGSIVDPTVVQFGGADVRYEEIDLDDPEAMKRVPTGRCANCGEDTYERNQFCSETCEDAWRADVLLGALR